MNELKDVLSEFANEVKPVDLQQRVLATSRRIGVRRNLTLTAAALCVVAVAGAMVLNTTATQSAPLQPASPAPSLPDPIVLPQLTEGVGIFGKDFSPIAGQHAVVPGCGNNKIKLDGDGINPRVTVNDVLESDVDRDGTADVIVSLGCGPDNIGSVPVNQVVVFKRSKGGLQAIGQVVGAQDGLRVSEITVSDGKINVFVYKGPELPPRSPFQWRTYAWQGDRFRQVDGPTYFPVKAVPTASLSVESAVVTLSEVDAGRYLGHLDIIVLNSGAASVQNTRISMDLPSQLKPTGQGWENCQEMRAEDSSRIDCAVGPLAAGARRELRLEVVAIGLPAGRGGQIQIAQWPALVLESSTPRTALVEIKVQ